MLKKSSYITDENPPKNYFSIEIAILKILGLSFSGNESSLYKLYAFIFNFFMFMYPLAQFGDLFKHKFDEVASIASYQFGVFVAISKTTLLLLNRRKFGKILTRLHQPPFIPNQERGGNIEEQLIKECLWFTKIQTITYSVCAGVSIILDATHCVIKRLRSDDYHDWRLAYGDLTVLNITYSPNYEITWLYQTFCITNVAFHFTTIDLITAGVLAHISCQFQILQNNLRRMVQNSYRDMVKNTSREAIVTDEVNASAIPWKYLRKSLKKTVQYHLEIISLANDMENLFQKLLLVVFLGTVGILCFMVYCASMLPMNDIKMLGIGIQTVTMCVQILLICYWGEVIIYESQQVGSAVFEADFVGTDLRFQKGLVLMMVRSKKPVKLTGGKFVDICLSTFTWIIRNSYSVFMVLRNNNRRRLD